MTSHNANGLPNWWDLEVDVVVLGSGGAGLASAVTAAAEGSTVAVLERTDKLGGTTAVSGGGAWIPNNHHIHVLGLKDSREEALTYLRYLSLGQVDEQLQEAFVDQAPQMLRFLEGRTPLRFQALMYPDYHPEFPGAKPGGRSLDPLPYDMKQLGEYADLIRLSPHNPLGVTMREAEEGPERLDYKALAQRMSQKVRGGGNALVGSLVKGCLAAGVNLFRDTRGRQLLCRDGAVIGIRAERNGQDFYVRGAQGVVLATGGFEWNDRLVKTFLRGPVHARCSPPWNEGDGLIMAMAVGASLGNMSEAWWKPMVHIPGEAYEGTPLYRSAHRERTKPGSLIVNRHGKRFVNEAHNYNDVGKAFHAFDPVEFAFINSPAWIIFDQGYKSRYFFATVSPVDAPPAWLKTAHTLRELAQLIGVNAEGLEATVAHFNRHARDGKDPDFRRGDSLYDRYYGDKDNKPNVTLGPVNTPPFYAVELHAGVSGTKGGPRTNSRAQVIDVWGNVIPGLYAAGNTMASVMGPSYPGPGATISPALTFGYIAGRSVAQEPQRKR